MLMGLSMKRIILPDRPESCEGKISPCNCLEARGLGAMSVQFAVACAACQEPPMPRRCRQTLAGRLATLRLIVPGVLLRRPTCRNATAHVSASCYFTTGPDGDPDAGGVPASVPTRLCIACGPASPQVSIPRRTSPRPPFAPSSVRHASGVQAKPKAATTDRGGGARRSLTDVRDAVATLAGITRSPSNAPVRRTCPPPNWT